MFEDESGKFLPAFVLTRGFLLYSATEIILKLKDTYKYIFDAGNMHGPALLTPKTPSKHSLGTEFLVTPSRQFALIVPNIPAQNSIRHLHISHNAPYLLPKILHKYVFHFSCVLQPSQEKLQTMLMQNFGGK